MRLFVTTAKDVQLFEEPYKYSKVKEMLTLDEEVILLKKIKGDYKKWWLIKTIDDEKEGYVIAEENLRECRFVKLLEYADLIEEDGQLWTLKKGTRGFIIKEPPASNYGHFTFRTEQFEFGKIKSSTKVGAPDMITYKMIYNFSWIAGFLKSAHIFYSGKVSFYVIQVVLLGAVFMVGLFVILAGIKFIFDYLKREYFL